MIYVYKCDTCHSKVEEQRPVEQRDEETTCECGGKLIRIEIPVGGSFILTGGGWFRDGY